MVAEPLRHGIHIFDTPFKSLDLSDPLGLRPNVEHPTDLVMQSKIRLATALLLPNTQLVISHLHGGTVLAPLVMIRTLTLSFPKEKTAKARCSLCWRRGRMVLPHCGMPTFYPKSVASELDTKEFKSVNHYTPVP